MTKAVIIIAPMATGVYVCMHVSKGDLRTEKPQYFRHYEYATAVCCREGHKVDSGLVIQLWLRLYIYLSPSSLSRLFTLHPLLFVCQMWVLGCEGRQ